MEHELFVPEDTLVNGVEGLLPSWQYASKFTVTKEVMAKAMLVLDGDEYEWPAILEMDGTRMSSIMGGMESRALVLAVPQQQPPVVEQLPVVNMLDEPCAALLVPGGITVLETKELLSAAYDGDLESTLIQIRGSNGSSFFSFKVSSIADPSIGLMACVSARISKAVLRPPMPNSPSELRLKLGTGVKLKAASAPPPADDETEFAHKTKAKVLAAMARVQAEDGKQAEDMQKLLTTGSRTIITNFQPPLAGKRNGGTVRC